MAIRIYKSYVDSSYKIQNINSSVIWSETFSSQETAVSYALQNGYASNEIKLGRN